MIFTQLPIIKQRLIVGSLFALLTFAIVFLSHVPAFKPICTGFLTAFIGMGMWEFYQIAHAKGLHPADKLGIALGTAYCIAVAISTQYPIAKMLPEITMLASLLTCFLYYFAKKDSPIINLSITVFGIVYLAIPLSCLISIIYFFEHNGIQDGRWWIAYLVCVTKLTDIGAYAIGAKFGRQKLAPYISPKKTWEGAIGGLVAGIAASICLALIASILNKGSFILSIGDSLWLGALVSLVAQCGDLAESLLKRDGGIKDSSHIPGLGGVLDILDSLVFTAPLMYIFLKISFE